MFCLRIYIIVGTKGVANALKSITAGPKRDMEKKWFSQLSDKRQCHHHTYDYLHVIFTG
jgi:hypothetical protein